MLLAIVLCTHFAESTKTTHWVPRAQWYQLNAVKRCASSVAVVWSEGGSEGRQGGGNVHSGDCLGPQVYSIQFSLSASAQVHK